MLPPTHRPHKKPLLLFPKNKPPIHHSRHAVLVTTYLLLNLPLKPHDDASLAEQSQSEKHFLTLSLAPSTFPERKALSNFEPGTIYFSGQLRQGFQYLLKCLSSISGRSLFDPEQLERRRRGESRTYADLEPQFLQYLAPVWEKNLHWSRRHRLPDYTLSQSVIVQREPHLRCFHSSCQIETDPKNSAPCFGECEHFLTLSLALYNSALYNFPTWRL